MERPLKTIIRQKRPQVANGHEQRPLVVRPVKSVLRSKGVRPNSSVVRWTGRDLIKRAE